MKLTMTAYRSYCRLYLYKHTRRNENGSQLEPTPEKCVCVVFRQHIEWISTCLMTSKLILTKGVPVAQGTERHSEDLWLSTTYMNPLFNLCHVQRQCVCLVRLPNEAEICYEEVCFWPLSLIHIDCRMCACTWIYFFILWSNISGIITHHRL